MTWKPTPTIKFYEALGAVADKRVALTESGAIVTSSSGNKKYEVMFDEKLNSITANDNGTYYQGYIGYPGIALLLIKGKLYFDPSKAELLKGIMWKDLNQEFKNDYEKVIECILSKIEPQIARELRCYINQLERDLLICRITKAGSVKLPPKGY